MSIRRNTEAAYASLPRGWRSAVELAFLAIIAACGDSDATPTPSPTPTPVVSTPAASVTPETVPEAVSQAFPGLPLDKIAAMNYTPEERRLVLTTVLEPGATAEGATVCKAFIEVALFAEDASILVLAKDYSELATCRRT